MPGRASATSQTASGLRRDHAEWPNLRDAMCGFPLSRMQPCLIESIGAALKNSSSTPRLRHLASRSAPPPLDIQRLQAYFGGPRERYVREPMRAKRCNRYRSKDTNGSADCQPVYGRSSVHARFMGAVSLRRDRQSVLHGPSRASRFGGFFVAYARLGPNTKSDKSRMAARSARG